MGMWGLNIKGGYFKEESQLKLYDKHKHVGSLIYGKNGSGKSSISRAIFEKDRLIKEEIKEEELEFSPLIFQAHEEHPKQGSKVMSEDEVSSFKYLIFNEEFVMKNIQFKTDGLDAIVMLGDQKDLHEKLESNKDEIEKSISERKLYITDLTDEDRMSSAKIKENIKKNLSERWSTTEKDIKDNSIKSAVTNSLIDKVIDLSENSRSYGDISEKITSLIKKLRNIRSLEKVEEINIKVLDYNFEKLKILLEKRIEKPDLNERENKILEVIKDTNGLMMSQTNNLIQSDTEDCPLCFQTINPNYKKEISIAIEKLLHTRAANEHIQELDKKELPNIDMTLDTYENIVASLTLKDLTQKIDLYNECIKSVNKKIFIKIQNPYSPIDIEEKIIKKCLNEINKVIEICNKEIKIFNNDIAEKNKILEEASKLNLDLAHKDVKSLISDYKKQSISESVLSRKIEGLNTLLEKLEAEGKQIEAELLNTNIACDLINDYLKYIFYDSERLTIHPDDKYYSIKCRGESIKLSSLSIGERNCIALCYFFSQLFKGKSMQKVFQEKCLLVMDDPISSFDFENKVGVFSFLRFILNEFHSSNQESRAIIFTHDLEVFNHLFKIYNDIKLKDKYSTIHLENKKVKFINSNDFNEYSDLLNQIFEFAHNQEAPVKQLSIGNIMRRVLEAFATFNYNLGIEGLTANEKVLDLLTTEKEKAYFKNRMYRLVLNSESHLYERTRGILTRGFAENFSVDEKVKTAKDIIILMHSLNPTHIDILLSNKNDSDQTLEEKLKLINSWRNEIFSSITR
ncbi:hypothetical protein BBI08_15820 [Planococcus halocryophilus]|uniref:Protein CR006 P-loop domain-containing protein n=1 Tax=Planococcus halocryophilus TaxID=1215089 RepID=A0A1C7DUB3_9BACL|nr:hypothetical protein BBI08_15820 [Planococcus halocryophilus]